MMQEYKDLVIQAKNDSKYMQKKLKKRKIRMCIYG